MFDPRTHYQNQRVAESYDRERFSSLAGRLFQRAELLTLRRALRHIPHDAWLLDAPCGTGRISQFLVDSGYRVICADISQEMLEVARNRLSQFNGRVQFSRGSADALPFATGSFDVVLSIRFLPHLSADLRQRMLSEMARVSRRWVIVSLSYSNGWYEARRNVKRWLGHQAPTRYPITEAELDEDLRAANLQEAKRFWTFRFASEEVLVLCEKAQIGS